MMLNGLNRALRVLSAWLSVLAGGVAHADDWHPLVMPVIQQAHGTSRPAALLAVVSVGDLQCRAQIDTGLDAPLRWHMAGASATQMEAQRVGLGELSQTTTSLPAGLAQACARNETVVSLGNGFFQQGSLVIDMAKRRVRYASRSLLSDGRGAGFRYVTSTNAGGWPVVLLSPNGQAPLEAVFDTGAASLDLGALTEPMWQLLTHVPAGSNPRADIREFSVQSWGKQIHCREAAVTESVMMGGEPQAAMRVIRCPELAFTPPPGVALIMGLGALRERVITLDYLSRRWLVE